MSEQRENKMGVLPIKQLIITMSLPMMVSMMVQALYNVVDSVFVARISENALTAVTLAFPLQNMMIAFGSGTGVGINALLSRSLGERRFERSDAAANTGILLAIVNYLIFLAIGILGTRAFIASQTKDPEILEYGAVYLRIVCCLSIGLFSQMTFERLLQSTGKTFYSMISQATGAIINMIMDPILIFGLFGAPRLGVAGAAYATIFGQVVAGIIGVALNVKKNTEIHISPARIFRPEAWTIREIYKVGIPTILMMSIGSVMTYLMNRILITFSTTATAVFGVYFKLQSFFFMPIFGLNNGLIPVLAYNYGAQKKKRIMEALRFAVFLAVSVMLVGTAVFMLIPDTLLALFNASPEMHEIGRIALRIICVHFPVAGVCIVLGSTFQAFAKGHYSLMTSAGRQLFVLIPAAWLLAQTGNVNNVWWAFLIAEAVSLVLSLFFVGKIRKEILEPMPED